MLHGVRPRNHTMDHDVIVVGAGPSVHGWPPFLLNVASMSC